MYSNIYSSNKHETYIVTIPHMLHGAGIFTKQLPEQNHPVMVNMPAPWFASGFMADCWR